MEDKNTADMRKDLLRTISKAMDRPHKWWYIHNSDGIELKHKEYFMIVRYGYGGPLGWGLGVLEFLLINTLFCLLPALFMMCFSYVSIYTDEYSKEHYLWRWGKTGRAIAKGVHKIIAHNEKERISKVHHDFLSRHF